MSNYVSVKISPTEYKHFLVDEAVLIYIKQLESAINDERVRDTLKELYPRLNQSKDNRSMSKLIESNKKFDEKNKPKKDDRDSYEGGFDSSMWLSTI